MARNTIKRPFLHLSRDAFADMVEEHLKLVLPNITHSMRLGDLDRRGIDVLQFQDGSGMPVKAIQCKGFERPINDEHISKLVNEVRKYQRYGPEVDEYWLVINKPITDPKGRKEIRAALAELEAGGKVNCAKLLDLDPFAKLLEQLAIEKFRSLATDRRRELQQRYLNSFDSIGYMAEVPAQLDGTPITNPVGAISEAVASEVASWGLGHTGASRKYPRYFVTGSFGFGKTIGLHALGQSWSDRGFHSVLIPAVSLDEEAFVNSAGIYDFLVQTLFSNEEDFSKDHVAYKLIREACKSVLNSEPWMLLIDAIDESDFWTDPNRLNILWFSIKEIGIPAAVSVRSELIDARPKEFFGEEKIRFFKRVDLQDWSSREMMAFLNAFVEARGATPPDSFARFLQVVKEDQYESIYGDIPRRPLFLQMLAEDAWNGTDPEDKLYRLYGKYFRAKLSRDWQRADMPERRVRFGSIVRKFGIEEAQEQLVLLMQNLALVASGLNGNEITSGSEVTMQRTQQQITQMQLDKAVGAVVGEVDMIEEVLLNSLILPSGRDPILRHRIFRFAHQTFLDWFLARAIVANNLTVENLSIVSQGFVSDMREAIANGEVLP